MLGARARWPHPWYLPGTGTRTPRDSHRCTVPCRQRVPGSFDLVSAASSLPSRAFGKGSGCSLAPLLSTNCTHSRRSLFLPSSCFGARPESLTSVCWFLANLLSRLVLLVSAKFRLLWTYRRWCQWRENSQREVEKEVLFKFKVS